MLSGSSVSEDLPSNSNQARYSEDVPSDEMIDSEEKEISILIDNLVEKLRERKNFSSKLVEKTCVLASVLGKMIVGDQMSEEYGLLQGLYKDINFMMQLNTHEFLKGRNAVLMAFLRSIAPSKNPNSYQLALVVEAIYHLRNNNLILPHCFMLNLIQTFISGSKTVTTLNGKLLPGGSDTTYRLWLTTNAEPIEYPTGDSDIFIDNCGHYIVKSYRVSSVKNPKPNVITACINIPWTKDETGMDGLQQQEELKPCHWMPNAKEKDVQQKMEELISDGKEKFVYYQYRYVYELFNFLASTSNRQMEENIENEIKKLDSTGSRRCENTKCLELYNNRKRKCDICGSKVSKVETEEPEDVNKTFHSVPKYFPLGEKTVGNRVKITMGDIVALNPNS